MKVLIRTFGLIIIGTIVCYVILNLININVINNEINRVTSLAINEAQKYAISKIKTNFIENENGELIEKDEQKDLSEFNDEYKNKFIEYFNTSVTNKQIFELDIKTNINEGIIYAKVSCNKRFVRDKEVLNIVSYDVENKDVITKDLSEVCTIEKKTETIDDVIPKTTKWNSVIKNTEWPMNIYSWTFKEPVNLKSYSLTIYAYINTAMDMLDVYWYPALRLYAIKNDGTEITIDQKGENNYKGQQTLSGTVDLMVKEVKLDITAYKPTNGYIKKINRCGCKNSSITYLKDIEEEVCTSEEIETTTSKKVYTNFRFHYEEINKELLDKLL